MSNRSGTTFSAPTDANRNRVLLGVSASDGKTPVALEVGPDGGLIITGALGTAALPGQAKIAVTGTAVQLPSNTLTSGVIITAKSTNSAPIVVGASGVANTADGTGNGYILEAGGSISFAVNNTNLLYINGTSGDIVSFAGS